MNKLKLLTMSDILAEDGLADTVKPRLTALGADCSKVLVIDESERELTLSDRRLTQAIDEAGAGLLVLDPIHAYLGDGVDMHRANEVRPIFKRLEQLAERTGCAIVLVGHMNKKMTTLRTARFERTDRTAAGHQVTVIVKPVEKR